jgi:hypothetical protein
VAQGPVAPTFVGPPVPPFIGPTAPVVVDNPPTGPVTPLRPVRSTTGAATATTLPGTVEPHGARTAETTTVPSRSTATRQEATGPKPRTSTRSGHDAGSTGGSRPTGFSPHDIGILPGSEALPVVHSIVTRSVSNPELPLGLALVVTLFLLVQHRIDRKDPKLAHAPREEAADLEFGGAVRFA